ncbi:MAG: ABC transporter ATP-binding protein [Solirubrobacteraceae bacterium]|nr:ABC transporter ATP-binding protein [Solirubrobacteraceae bacterium]
MSAPVLELSGITAGYGAAPVLRDVDLTVEAGSIVALLGPNGAGKTTLLRVASGQLRPSAGEVRVGGAAMTTAAPHRRARAGLCLVPEGRGVFRELTVRENLRLMTPPWERAAEPRRVFDAFPILEERAGQVAGTMSGGQQQMLALARCWLARPAVVLLDEVSMGLAPRIVDEIFAALTGLAAEGTSLVLVEQYVDRALAMADRVHLLTRGTTTFTGAPGELDRDDVLRRYLGGSDGDPDASGAGRSASAAGDGPGTPEGEATDG